ncbi:hypothetical protein NQ315_012882 [Exocentrus adspersus]|uniref:Double jelly roll-like domain-containing protein n=1 Tax=Exocentrus adspersus TaxID=1586481 RepID=A0AAV8VGI7_9CUCU|nr:hypothetical protein NQ315_012882 [Exocentrus adspersus]
MSEELQIFQDPQFDTSVIREETRTYYPFVKSFKNNDEIEITVYQQDALLQISEAALIIEGTLTKTAGAGDIVFTNNAGAYLFYSISFELNGKELDRVRDPGTVSSIRGYLCYGKNEEHSMAGWNLNSPHMVIYNAATKTFILRIPLCHLLGIFYDYKRVMFGKQTLRLLRARTDVNCYKVTTADTVGELTITNIELKVKNLFLNDVQKLNLLTQINEDKPILIPFRQWEFHELPTFTEGSTKEIWSVKTCTNVESPRYVIVAFQKGRKDVKTEDIMGFDNVDISNLKVHINSEYYPYEDMNLNFDGLKYTEVYNMYLRFAKMFATNSTPSITYPLFNTTSLFVIDCSKSDDSLKSSTIDLKLEIESRKGFPRGVRAYCVVVHDRIMEYLPLSGVVRSFI